MKSAKMPCIFFGHGSPMNALAQNDFSRFLNRTGERLAKPEAILCISAHWETPGTKVLKSSSPKTIHDFGGFPKELYQVQYPAPGDLELADQITQLLKANSAESTPEWGLDHGSWSILIHLYPKAQIPVLQLSMDQNLSLKEHFELAKNLKPIREDGVLIIGSGNITHNLRAIDWGPNPKAFAWALEFDEHIKNAIIDKNMSHLFNEVPRYQSLWRQALPTLEHYLPLLYVLGASDESDQPKFIYEEMQMGSLSMRAVEMNS